MSCAYLHGAHCKETGCWSVLDHTCLCTSANTHVFVCVCVTQELKNTSTQCNGLRSQVHLATQAKEAARMQDLNSQAVSPNSVVCAGHQVLAF